MAVKMSGKIKTKGKSTIKSVLLQPIRADNSKITVDSTIITVDGGNI